MQILMTGASGLVGKELTSILKAERNEVIPLVRNRNQKGIFWDPENNEIDLSSMEGSNAVVHLAGESIAAKRWTESFKDKIMQSRVRGTSLLAEGLKKLKSPPKKFLSASAVGYYADAGNQKILESSPPDDSFLSRVCVAWENAAYLASPIVPVTTCRIGVVLSKNGGALEKMLTPFRLGLGGKMGDGQQYMPWIDLNDLCRAFAFLINQPKAEGAFNLTAPEPVTQEEFSKSLSKILNRPNFVHTPKWLLKATLGEMAEELLLKSMRAYPDQLLKRGFKFEYDELEKSLRHWIN